MKKYDCNKTLDYIHERKRMCASFLVCINSCPLAPLHSCGFSGTTQEHIAIVQGWSDEHPEMDETCI